MNFSGGVDWKTFALKTEKEIEGWSYDCEIKSEGNRTSL
jgi:hypothetical protein